LIISSIAVLSESPRVVGRGLAVDLARDDRCRRDVWLASPADVHSPVCGVSWPVILRFMLIRAVAATLCVVVALVGCSSDPEPEPLPPIESFSPSPVALPMPSEAAAETPQGAAAFARYFFALVNEGLSTGDAAGVRAVSALDCGGCKNLIGAIEEPPKPGERIEGGLFTIQFAEAPPVDAGDVVVEITYEVTEVRVYAADGSLLRTTPAVKATNGQVRLVRQDGSWIVQGFRSIEP
jgi:hypothetical protein